MKFYPKAGVYKASNVCFDPEEVSAYSYQWWKFVTRIGPLTVFNSYPYSNTTRRHQWKVKSLMRSLGIDIHADIEVPRGVGADDWAQGAINLYQERIETLKQEMLKGRPSKNLERAAAIKELRAKQRQVAHLFKMEVANA